VFNYIFFKFLVWGRMTSTENQERRSQRRRRKSERGQKYQREVANGRARPDGCIMLAVASRAFGYFLWVFPFFGGVI
jgi:hypothetical protein